jgi:hypothetical protein
MLFCTEFLLGILHFLEHKEQEEIILTVGAGYVVPNEVTYNQYNVLTSYLQSNVINITDADDRLRYIHADQYLEFKKISYDNWRLRFIDYNGKDVLYLVPIPFQTSSLTHDKEKQLHDFIDDGFTVLYTSFNPEMHPSSGDGADVFFGIYTNFYDNGDPLFFTLQTDPGMSGYSCCGIMMVRYSCCFTDFVADNILFVKEEIIKAIYRSYIN